MNIKKTIVILGMPRSFTSMTSGGLEKIGVNMGKDMIGKDWSNKLGHFENIDFVNLNKDIFKWAGHNWMNPPSLEKVLEYPDKEKIKATVEKNQDILWGWKDPRTAITIELYLPYLINPIFIVCYRSFIEIAQSLKRRDKTPIDEGLKIAEIYYNRIQEFLKKYYAR